MKAQSLAAIALGSVLASGAAAQDELIEQIVKAAVRAQGFPCSSVYSVEPMFEISDGRTWLWAECGDGRAWALRVDPNTGWVWSVQQCFEIGGWAECLIEEPDDDEVSDLGEIEITR